jgi:hypothetical protein
MTPQIISMILWCGFCGGKLIRAETIVANNKIVPTVVDGRSDIRFSCGVKPLRLFFMIVLGTTALVDSL